MIWIAIIIYLLIGCGVAWYLLKDADEGYWQVTGGINDKPLKVKWVKFNDDKFLWFSLITLWGILAIELILDLFFKDKNSYL